MRMVLLFFVFCVSSCAGTEKEVEYTPILDQQGSDYIDGVVQTEELDRIDEQC
jgi:hypothetical protein